MGRTSMPGSTSVGGRDAPGGPTLREHATIVPDAAGGPLAALAAARRADGRRRRAALARATGRSTCSLLGRRRSAVGDRAARDRGRPRRRPLAVVDLALGVACVVALWWRRRIRPRSGVGTDAGLDRRRPRRAAPRCSRSSTRRCAPRARGLIVVWTLALAAAFLYPLVYPERRHLLAGRSSIGAADHRRRGRLGPVRARPARARATRCASAPRGWRPSSGCTSSRRARPSGAGSRARCTTCSRTACRC